MEKRWIDVFLENYKGTSEQAKSIENFVKAHYKGGSYVPWATMERLTYECDPEAEFSVVLNPYSGILHSNSIDIRQYQKSAKSSKGSTELTVEETEQVATAMSHMVVVKLVFMGKEFIEYYPLQDNEYKAMKAFDQNLVNNALQRAKAKVASRATGLALKLYEGLDLQFLEAEGELKTPEVKTVPEVKKSETKKVETKKESTIADAQIEAIKAAKLAEQKQKEDVQKVIDKIPPKEVVSDSLPQDFEDAGKEELPYSEDALSVAKFLYNQIQTNSAKFAPILQRLNTGIVNRFKFALELTDSLEELAVKMNHFGTPTKFQAQVENLLGLK